MVDAQIKFDPKLFPYGSWLLCPPSHFEVTYEINPWMSVKRPAEIKRAQTHWLGLHHTLIRLGAWIEYVEPQRGLPDMVYTANAGLVRGKKVVLSKFRHAERQGEEQYFRSWFNGYGFEVLELAGGAFEGEGDALFAGQRLFLGYGFRSDRDMLPKVAQALDVDDFVCCELVDARFYHLDTCFCPLTASLAFYHPSAFSAEGRRMLQEKIELISIPEHDALRFACNSVVLGNNVIMPSGCTETAALLQERGFLVFQVELDEFMKGGGSAKCLSLRLQ